MKKLSLLLLLFSFAGIAPAQRTLFSTPLENGTIAAYIKTLPNRQYAIYAWQPEQQGTFYTPHLLWLDSKGTLIRNIFSPDSFEVTGASSIGVHSQGCILETHKGFSDLSYWEKQLIYFDTNGKIKWQRNFINTFVPFLYGSSYVEEPDNQLKVILVDTSGLATIELLDNNGSTVTVKTIPKNLDRTIAFNLIKVTDNRYVFSTNGSYLPPYNAINLSRLFCIDSAGTILWERAFNNDTLNMGIIDNVLLLDNQIYVKTWKQESNTALHYTLYKLNTDGELLKQQTATINATTYSYLSRLIPSKDRGFYFFWNEANGSSLMPSTIVKYDQELNLKWSRIFPEFTFSIDSTSCNGIVRSYRNNDNFYGSTIHAFVDPELADACDQCETIVYPNPSSTDHFNLRSSYYEVAIQHTELYDMAGRLVWKFDMPESNTEFTLKHDLADGMYLCRVTCDNGKTQMKRIVVNR